MLYCVYHRLFNAWGLPVLIKSIYGMYGARCDIEIVNRWHFKKLLPLSLYIRHYDHILKESGVFDTSSSRTIYIETPQRVSSKLPSISIIFSLAAK